MPQTASGLTLESIKLEQAKTGKMIADFENQPEKIEPLICTIDGYAYYLGPQAVGQMAWKDAAPWCVSRGDGYELPSRLVLLACYENPELREGFDTDDWYWTASEFDASNAWLQNFSNGYQDDTSKTTAYYVRAVRKVLI